VLQGVDDQVRRVLRAGAELKHRQNLGEGINGYPQPEHLLRTPQPGAQFVQLKVREPEMAEGALVQDLSMLTSTQEPGGDRGLTVAEDSLRGGRVEPFGQRREHPCNLLGRGFQTVQRSVVSSAECGMTGRASKGRDLLSATMCAIPNQSVDGSVCDAEVRALLVGTSEAFGGYPSGGLPAGFSPHSRGVLVQEQVSYPARGCRRGDRRGSQEGFMA
jgi:hypothetical protein